MVLTVGLACATDFQENGSHSQIELADVKGLPNPDAVHPSLFWRKNTETLWRGDTSNEGIDAFKTGILPHAIEKKLPKQDWVYDWLRHKGDSSKSVFSSTTYDEKLAIALAQHWGNGWVYEIYAPGGIDQQASVGKDQKTGESEVSFPGGIKGTFIKQACVYKNDQLQNCEMNPLFSYPKWSEAPEEVSAAGFNIIELKYITPKAGCVGLDITRETPSDLCLIPGVAEPELREDSLERIRKEGIRIRYNVSDRRSDISERFVLILSQDPVSGDSKFVARQEIPYDAPDVGVILIGADKITDPDRQYLSWRMGITHNNHDDKLKEPISTAVVSGQSWL
ncbi:scabin-related ADP-ribosyltransferase [Paraburkholderia aspalathi]|uniref:scabin-related ADP-ribosyltransferase n=1 Tax=Paraburkholderia aspalathi TaxID=1324617 RepID=UPI0038BC52CF